MKKILLATAAVALMFTACKKDDDKNTTPANTWTVNGTTYTATSVTANSTANSLTAIDAANNTISCVFTKMPTSSGTYKIVESASASDEVTIGSTLATSSIYLSKTEGKTAEVTVNGTKVSIKVPEIWAMKAASTTDSVKITADLTQTN